MGTWKGIVGRSFTVEEFRQYVAGLKWNEWRPEFIVLHNTEGLTEPGGLSEQYIRDMEHEYRDINGWSAGPHLFVDSEKIWAFTSLLTPGVHANSWNNRTIGVEMEGDYDREPFDSGRGLMVQHNAVAGVAILSQAVRLNPDTVMFHRENGETTHHCPGSNVNKAQFMQKVQDYLAEQPNPPSALVNDAPQGGQPMSYRVKANPLNIRSGPGTNYEAVGTVSAGDVIAPVDTLGWVPVLLEDNSIGWLAQQYLEETLAASSATATPSSSPAVQGGPDFSTKEGTIAAIKAECVNQGIGSAAQIAYVLATVDWETGHAWKPVREAFWKDEEWRRNNLSRYYPYYGRGFVQITWKENYQKYAKILGVDLEGNPDLALEPENAMFILVHGFKTGAFTGKKINDYINEGGTDFHNARRCINGVDRAEEIAAIAQRFLKA